MNRIRLSFISLVLIFLLPGIALCAPDNQKEKHANTEKVSLRLLWKHQFQFAGYYMAKEKGFYADAGLDVDITEIEHSVDNTQAVLSGKIDFAVGRSSIMVNRGRGEDIVALFSAFQRSPLMLLTLKSSGIASPGDLVNRSVMITPDTKNSSALLAMMIQAGIREGEFNRQKHSFNLDDLIYGRTDAMASYISNEPYQLAQRNIPYNIIHPANHGFNIYSDILFTSGKMTRERPDLTARFYEASLRGWEYAFDNITETAEVISRSYNSQNRSMEALLFEGNALKTLAFDSKGRFGTIDPEHLDRSAQIYLISGTVNKKLDLDGFIYSPDNKGFRLSYQESEIVKQHTEIRICTDPDWMPYEEQRKGSHTGIIADYMQLIANKTGLNFVVVPTDSWKQSFTYVGQGKCDIMSGVIQTPTRNRTMDFTHAYLSLPLVIASKTQELSMDSFSEIIAIPRNFAYDETFRRRYPNAKTVPVDTSIQGLRMVENGDVFGYLGDNANINYLIEEQDIKEVYVNENVGDIADISIGVAKEKPALLSLLNKGIEAISADEHNRILSRWISVPKQNGIDPKLLWALGSIIFIIGLIGLYRHGLAIYRNKILQELASRDHLTGIANRHAIISKLTEYMSIADRYKKPLSIIFFDIDDFKKINDTYGHAIGDQVLVKFTSFVERGFG